MGQRKTEKTSCRCAGLCCLPRSQPSSTATTAPAGKDAWMHDGAMAIRRNPVRTGQGRTWNNMEELRTQHVFAWVAHFSAAPCTPSNRSVRLRPLPSRARMLATPCSDTAAAPSRMQWPPRAYYDHNLRTCRQHRLGPHPATDGWAGDGCPGAAGRFPGGKRPDLLIIALVLQRRVY